MANKLLTKYEFEKEMYRTMRLSGWKPLRSDWNKPFNKRRGTWQN